LADRDNFIVATGMTDPKLCPPRTWLRGLPSADAGDLVAVSEAVAELSGLKQGAEKSSV
jgi:hypothetical protein